MKALRFISLFVVLLGGLVVTARASDIVLTMPFENVSGKPEYNWIGESFAITLGNLLDTPGMIAIGPEERNLAYERVGLTASDLLTRAAVIRIADSAQANLSVVGTYDIGGDARNPTIAISARLIDAREGRLAATKVFQDSGLLKRLQEMQGKLAWSILYERNPSVTYSKDHLVKRAVNIPPRAYESLVKGIQTRDQKLRENFLRRAIHEFETAGAPGHYAQAYYELGLVYLSQKKYPEAIKSFKELTPDDQHFLESRFYLGVTLATLGAHKEALDAFDKLVKPMPLLEVWNNVAAMQIASGSLDDAVKTIRNAVANSPYDPIYRFNLGYALYRYGKFDQAAEHLRVAISANANDGEAQYLLARCLRATGPADEARQADDEARRLLDNRYAKWEVQPEQMGQLARLKTEFSRAQFFKLERQQQQTAGLPSSQVIIQQRSLDKAKQLSAAGRDAEALTELNQLLGSNGALAEAHLLRGQILQRRKESDLAIHAYLSAISWSPRMVAAHVGLGQIYLAKGDRARAIAHINQAIEIDPQDREAVALFRQIGSGR
jgi:tetratricopeptide (TPR) repeat protein